MKEGEIEHMEKFEIRRSLQSLDTEIQRSCNASEVGVCLPGFIGTIVKEVRLSEFDNPPEWLPLEEAD